MVEQHEAHGGGERGGSECEHGWYGSASAGIASGEYAVGEVEAVARGGGAAASPAARSCGGRRGLRRWCRCDAEGGGERGREEGAREGMVSEFVVAVSARVFQTCLVWPLYSLLLNPIHLIYTPIREVNSRIIRVSGELS